jgi:hypothetical protein
MFSISIMPEETTFGQTFELVSQSPKEKKNTIEPSGFIRLATAWPDRTWENYGLSQATLLTWSKGTGWQKSRHKLILRDLLDPKLVAVVGEDYFLFPNEEVDRLMGEWAQKNHYKLYEDSRYSFSSRNGNAVFRCYLPEDEQIGSYFIGGRRDQVRTGFTVRNSIDGTMGFGVDLFTFRGLCTNGSIVYTPQGSRAFSARELKNATEASLYARHSKSLSNVINQFDAYINDLQEAGKAIADYYTQLAETKLNERIAKKLMESQLPKAYLPFEIRKEDQRPLFDSYKDMWETYNDITAAIWHNTKADMRTKYAYFNELHKTLYAAVPPS